MYPKLAEKIYNREAKSSHNAPKGLRQWDIFEMATSGEHIPIDVAVYIRDHYFPGESLENLFERDNNTQALSVAEAGCIMRNTMPGEVMPEIANTVLSHVCSTVQNVGSDRGIIYLMGWCLAIGRAAGVKEERARRAGVNKKEAGAA